MKKSQLFLLLVLLACIKSISAQELSLYIKKGNALVGQMEYKAGAVVLIKPNELTLVETGSLVILKGDNMIAEVKPGKYKHSELKKLLTAKRTFTESFINTATNQQISTKRSAGVVTRGDNDDPWAYSPADSLFILSDSLILKTGKNPLKLMTPIKIYAEFGKDTIYLSSDKLNHKFKTPPEGKYCWEYKAKLGSVTKLYKNWFTVPSDEPKKQKLVAYHEYERNLKDFSAEMRSLLLEEFLEVNNIYFDLK
jgi:hypothetical protein